MVRHYWEDFPVGHVRTFGRYEVTREAVLAFAQAFDPQPFHLDDDAAASSMFGRLAASGWHTCAIVMRMLCDEYLLESASLGSPGVDQIRWTAPVFPGDTLRVRLEIIESRPLASRPQVGMIRIGYEVFNQHGASVLTMQGLGFFARRPGAGGSTAA